MNTNAYYPIVLTQLGAKRVVVFGGGAVGERKISGLLTAGARVTIISPQVNAQLQTWADQGAILWEKRSYQDGDCTGAFLIFAATDQRKVNQRIAREAANLNILCNVADDRREGDFHLPAIYRDDDYMISINTYGAFPAKARQLRDKIAAWLGGSIER